MKLVTVQEMHTIEQQANSGGLSYEQMMDETQVLLKILAYADKEIEAGETVPIEDVMAEFGVEAVQV